MHENQCCEDRCDTDGERDTGLAMLTRDETD